MLRQLQAATRFDAPGFVPLTLESTRLGWVRAEFAQALALHPETFVQDAGSVRIVSVARLDAAVHALAESGWITGWRSERYPVRSNGAVLFDLERAAFRRFGLLASAAHLNGWVRDGNGCRLWIARRSATKPVDPGLLDNLVGGGIAAGSSPWRTLLKECDEEAGLPARLARAAVPAGSFRVTHTVANGLHDEVIHVFDLELPADFVPCNRDGEVADFMLLPPAAVAEQLAADAFTVDAGAVTIDFLWRRGALRDPAIGEALAALRAREHP